MSHVESLLEQLSGIAGAIDPAASEEAVADQMEAACKIVERVVLFCPDVDPWEPDHPHSVAKVEAFNQFARCHDILKRNEHVPGLMAWWDNAEIIARSIRESLTDLSLFEITVIAGCVENDQRHEVDVVRLLQWLYAPALARIVVDAYATNPQFPEVLVLDFEEYSDQLPFEFPMAMLEEYLTEQREREQVRE